MSEKNKFEPKNEFKKCAPSKKFDNESNTCFTLDQLIKMTNAYNNNTKNVDKIQLKENYNNNNKDYKKYLLKELIEKLPNSCNSQECLLKEDYIVNLKDFDILYNTFRPLGPNEKTKWLSTSDINQIMIQYTFKYPEFKFYGALPIDFKYIETPIDYNKNYFSVISNHYKKNIYKLGFILNLDKHYESGSHWVALYTDLKNKQIYFFDSYGYEPKNEIIELMDIYAKWINNNEKMINGGKTNKIKKILNFTNGKSNQYKNIDIQYNTFRHQFKNSECGVYSVNFILRLLNGENFKDITSNIVSDDKVNECRKVYFRFNN
jgi:hypothetical protein